MTHPLIDPRLMHAECAYTANQMYERMKALTGIPLHHLKRIEESNFAPGWEGELDPFASHFIHGPSASGKTHGMCSLILRGICEWTVRHHNNRDRDMRTSFLFVSVPELLEALRLSYNGEKHPILNRDVINSASFLFLDDLGAQKTTDWVCEMLYLILNHRFENLKHICITSNQSLTKLSQTIGVRNVSRLHQMCKIVEIGKDNRPKLEKNR